MNNIYKQLSKLVLVLLIFLSSQSAFTQGCTNTFEFGSFDASTLADELQVIDDCNFYGDYSVITNVVKGSTLRFGITGGVGFITVRAGSPDGLLVTSGAGTATITSFTGSDLYVHWNSDPSCGAVGGTCIQTTIECVNCIGCIADAEFLSINISTDLVAEGSFISGCVFANEYMEFTGVPSTEDVEFISEDTYLVVRTGTPTGPVLGTGFGSVEVSPLGDNLYVHFFSGANCTVSTPQICRPISVVCTSCPFLDPEDGSCFNSLEFGDFDITNLSDGPITLNDCQFESEHTKITGVPGDGTISFGVSFSLGGTYLTVREGTPNGPVVNQGFAPLLVDCSGKDLFVHWNTNASCGTATNCKTTTVSCINCPECPLGFIGSLCDDGNPNTSTSVIKPNCVCGTGQFITQSDNCEDIIDDISCNETTGGNLTNNTLSAVPLASCNTEALRDAWYKIEPNPFRVYDITLSPGPFSAFWNGGLEIYSGTCQNLELVECVSGGPSEQTINLDDPGSSTLYIRVFATSAIEDSYELSVECSLPCTDPFPAVAEPSLFTTINTNNANASWSPVVGQIGCQVQVRQAGEAILGAQIIGGANASSFNIPFSALQSGTDYEWRVRCGCSQTPLIAGPFTSWQPFSTPAGIVINSNPNPTSGPSNVSFNLEQSGYTTLEVFDMSGRMIESLFAGNAQRKQEYRFEFDGSSLPNGIYIYRVTTLKETAVEKFMIAK